MLNNCLISKIYSYYDHIRSFANSALLILLLTFSFPFEAHAETIKLNSDRGSVTVHVPKDQDASKELPLIILLHGLGADGHKQENGGKIKITPNTEIDFNGMQFAKHVDGDNPFLFVYPNGSQQSELSYRYWNATDACCDFFNSDVDDAKFLIELADKIYAHSDVVGKRGNLYIVGHSNGGFMAHAMACAYGDKIKAIVSFAGVTYRKNSDCIEAVRATSKKISPSHILQIHGTKDEIISYTASNQFGAFPVINPKWYPGAIETGQNWANLFKDIDVCNGKKLPPEVNYNLRLIDGANTVTQTKFSCDEKTGASIEVWLLKDVSHIPKLHENFSKTILDYLFTLK